MEADGDWLTDIRRILLDGLRGTGACAFLFGSRATGAVHGLSDVDIAVLPGSPLPAGLLAEIREAIEESHCPYEVDLVDLSDSDAAFRERVAREGVSWSD